MTHRLFFLACAVTVAWLPCGASSGELENAQSGYARSNDEYYKSIRFQNLDEKMLIRREAEISGQAIVDQHRAFENAFNQSMQKSGLVSGDVSDGPAEEPAESKRVLGTNTRQIAPIPMGTSAGGGYQRKSGSSGDEYVPKRRDDEPLRFDKTGVEQTVRFGGTESDAKSRQPASK